MYYKEYECSGLDFDVRIPTMLVSGFRKKGMIQQADILMNKTVRNIRLDDDKPFTPILQQEWGNEEYVSVVKPLLKLGDVKGSQETYRPPPCGYCAYCGRAMLLCSHLPLLFIIPLVLITVPTYVPTTYRFK
ncbi:Uncharacterized protein Rs2_25005 [Raphanus sativus]|nr:Uncharacterized protein Rs2_25005 [Raphanus sativus]